MALKVYSGTDLSKTYLGSNTTTNQGVFYPIVNPSSISSLQYWFDPVENTVTTNGSDQVTSISNSGNIGGGFNFYPGTATFDPATKTNFVRGTGNTKYYRFAGNFNDSMYTVWRSMKNDGFIAKTVISISKTVDYLGEGYRKWGISWTSDPAVSIGEINGVAHPNESSTQTLNISLNTSGGKNIISPDNALTGSYSNGQSDFVFFATTCTDGDWVNQASSIRFQSNTGNNTSTSQGNPYTSTSYYNAFGIHIAGNDYDPGAERGTDDYAGVMVFDEVLDEETIGGIYRYYKETRGYSIV